MRDDPEDISENPSDVDVPVACDYVDVTLQRGDQPRLVFQPHRHGGAPAGVAFSLELEGARGLSRHLAKLLEAGQDAD